MKKIICALVFSAFAGVSAFAENGSGLRTLGGYDPDYDVEESIRQGRDERLSEAQREFDEGPRESTLRLSVAPLYLWKMYSDFGGGDGWGLSTELLFQANSDTPDFKFLFGGELLILGAEADLGGRKTEMQTVNLMMTLGCAYDFSPQFSAGMLLGYGLIGASYFEEKFASGERDESGTMNTVVSFKPYAEYMLNKNFGIYAAYRYVYMGPSVISSVADWGDFETAAHAVEVGFRYRF